LDTSCSTTTAAVAPARAHPGVPFVLHRPIAYQRGRRRPTQATDGPTLQDNHQTSYISRAGRRSPRSSQAIRHTSQPSNPGRCSIFRTKFPACLRLLVRARSLMRSDIQEDGVPFGGLATPSRCGKNLAPEPWKVEVPPMAQGRSHTLVLSVLLGYWLDCCFTAREASP
jgi:hypothetical protein